MSKPDVTPRPGLLLGSSEFQTEADAHLQGRVRTLFLVILAIAVGLYVLATAVVLLWPSNWQGHPFLAPDRLIQLASIPLAGAGVFVLGRRSFGARALRVWDAAALHLAIGICLAIYVAAYKHAATSMSALLALFLILRAVIVPSSARTTVLLSAPTLVGLFAIQWAFGTLYVWPDQTLPAEYFPAKVVWTQVVMGSAVAVAAIASHVTFGLRRAVFEARRLGQYRLEEKVGEGSMGEVYRATHAMLRRPTAVKLLRPEITGEETIERFEREVQETSRLMHPNTVSIYDYGRTPDGVFYYAMEYLDGDDLRSIVERTGPLPAGRVIHVLRQVCGALAEAHNKGLVHRDIKPGNIVLCNYGDGQDMVKLVDFGLVKDIAEQDSRLTQTGRLCGTPETLAPEVLGGEEATGQSDLYSLAAVGCYVLTGKAIFDAQTVAEFVGHHLHSDPIPPRQRNPGLPADLDAILLRCLAKDPAERPNGVTALSVALDKCSAAGDWTRELAAAWWRDR